MVLGPQFENTHWERPDGQTEYYTPNARGEVQTSTTAPSVPTQGLLTHPRYGTGTPGDPSETPKQRVGVIAEALHLDSPSLYRLNRRTVSRRMYGTETAPTDASTNAAQVTELLQNAAQSGLPTSTFKKLDAQTIVHPTLRGSSGAMQPADPRSGRVAQVIINPGATRGGTLMHELGHVRDPDVNNERLLLTKASEPGDPMLEGKADAHEDVYHLHKDHLASALTGEKRNQDIEWHGYTPGSWKGDTTSAALYVASRQHHALAEAGVIDRGDPPVPVSGNGKSFSQNRKLALGQMFTEHEHVRDVLAKTRDYSTFSPLTKPGEEAAAYFQRNQLAEYNKTQPYLPGMSDRALKKSSS